MGKDLSKVEYIFQFCDGGSCRKAGSELAIRDARAQLKNKGLWQQVHTMKTRCNGRCEDAPTWIVFPGNYWYKNLNPEKAIEILASHLEEQKPIEDYLLYQPDWERVRSEKERHKEPATFKLLSDAQLGPLFSARMPSSEQDLYPLLLYCFERYQQIMVQLPGEDALALKETPEVDYTDMYDISIRSSEISILLAIAPLPQEVSAEVIERKISLTEVLQIPAGATPAREGLRFRDKWGKDLLCIWFKEDKGEIWQHILRNFLNIEAQQPQPLEGSTHSKG